jgi:alkylhydroperoxidase/carboxymuconolactone decarboxylase family protein YurZ
MPNPSRAAEQIRKGYPDVWNCFTELADACHDAGPLDEKTRRLVKLALAIGAGTEGGTHSAVRHAREAGITVKEMEHVAMLSVTTVGFPAAGRAFSWIRDTRGRSHSEIE